MSFQHFIVIFINDDGVFESIVGDISRFFGIIPKSITELCNYICENSNEKSEIICNFFDEKNPLDTKTICLINNIDISLTFSRKGSILFLKDDSHNHNVTQKLRLVEKYKMKVNEYGIRSKQIYTSSINLLIVQSKDQQVFLRVVNEFNKYHIADSRFSRMVAFFPDKDAKEVFSIILSLIDLPFCQFVTHRCKSAATFVSGNQINKSRVISQGYDESKLAISTLPQFRYATSLSFLSLMDSSISFDEIHNISVTGGDIQQFVIIIK